MKNEPLYMVRLSCNDLSAAVSWYNQQGFSTVCSEPEVPAAWLEKDCFILCLSESAADSPALVSYWEKPDYAIRKLEDLGLIFNFSADAAGNHFEAHFTDPAGMPVIVADRTDLPDEISHCDFNGELAIPSTNSFQDSINFWHSLGFKIQPATAQPHAWAVLKHSNMTVAIHQSLNWEKPGMCFNKKSYPFQIISEAEFEIKVYEKLKIGRTIDGCRIYHLG